MRRRRQRPLSGRILRAVIPLGRRVTLIQSMLSAVADALEAREGVVLTDVPGGGGLAGGHNLTVTSIRPGPPEQMVATLVRAAERLGYERDERLRGRTVNGPNLYWYRFLDVPMLPHLAFTIARPGEQVDGFAVPEGSVGVRFNLSAGSTSFENGRSLGTLSQATKSHLKERGVDFTPPPTWQRFWYWCWARSAIRARVAWTARRIGGFKGRPLATWFFGAELAGPYTLGVATIRSGEPPRALEAIELAVQRSHAREGADIGLVAYGPGEFVDPAAPSVPDGSAGVIVTVTVGRRRSRRDLNPAQVAPPRP